MKTLHKIILTSIFLFTNTAQAFNLNTDAIKNVFEIIFSDAYLSEFQNPEDKLALDYLKKTYEAIDRRKLAQRINEDQEEYLISANIGELKNLRDGRENLARTLGDKDPSIAVLTEGISKERKRLGHWCQDFLDDVKENPILFLHPLKGFIVHLVKPCAPGLSALEPVSEQLKTSLLSVFTEHKLISEDAVEKELNLDLTAITDKFLKSNPEKKCLVIGASHVGDVKWLPYDPHLNCLVVNIDPLRGPDIIGSITDLLEVLPDEHFETVVEASNMTALLTEGENPHHLFRVLKPGGCIQNPDNLSIDHCTSLSSESVNDIFTNIGFIREDHRLTKPKQ